jgi:glycosyltransferase 2 family protein
MGKTVFQKLIRIGSFILFAVFLLLSWTLFDVDTLSKQLSQLFKQYNWLLFITICYLMAFICRAISWRMYGSEKAAFHVYLFALFYSLFFNHLFPVKVGEVVRIGVLAKEKNEAWDTAFHSVVVMRMLDLLCLGLFSFVGALFIGVSLSFTHFLTVMLLLALLSLLMILFLKKKWLTFYRKHVTLLKAAFFHKKSAVMVLLTAISWVLEAAVLYGIVQAVQLDLSFLKAVWVNSLTVASQVFQFAPGGIATYESVMSFSLVQVEMSWKDAYHLAILTHGYKFLFSFLAGGAAFLFHPISLSHLSLWRKKRGEKL